MNDFDNSTLFESLDAAQAARKQLQAAEQKLVLTNGCFDLLHPGHLYFLRNARAEGDRLWVALNSDASVRALKGPLRPVLGQTERAYALAALEFVDGILIFDTPRLDGEIRTLGPDVYVKAGDYTLETLNAQERQALEAVGARIAFLPFLEGYSTTRLIEKIAAAADTF
ncbi:MAG: adenylyltransferase/cytidyltransferase family protein [Opitutales bacterium]